MGREEVWKGGGGLKGIYYYRPHIRMVCAIELYIPRVAPRCAESVMAARDCLVRTLVVDAQVLYLSSAFSYPSLVLSFTTVHL